MAIKIDPLTGHGQAIEYTVMNMSKYQIYFNTTNTSDNNNTENFWHFVNHSYQVKMFLFK